MLSGVYLLLFLSPARLSPRIASVYYLSGNYFDFDNRVSLSLLDPQQFYCSPKFNRSSSTITTFSPVALLLLCYDNFIAYYDRRALICPGYHNELLFLRFISLPLLLLLLRPPEVPTGSRCVIALLLLRLIPDHCKSYQQFGFYCPLVGSIASE